MKGNTFLFITFTFTDFQNFSSVTTKVTGDKKHYGIDKRTRAIQ